MNSEDIRNLAHRFTKDAWDRRDVSAFDKLLDEEFRDHDGLPGQQPGREGYKEVAAGFFRAFPDLHVWNEAVIVEGDIAVLRWRAEGTHREELMGMTATHSKVSLKGVDIVRVADGKITERWGEFDALGMMQQIQSK